eukprot:scaffold55604_cov78-Cyclotella_meneghiniana.AAC.2
MIVPYSSVPPYTSLSDLKTPHFISNPQIRFDRLLEACMNWVSPWKQEEDGVGGPILWTYVRSRFASFRSRFASFRSLRLYLHGAERISF